MQIYGVDFTSRPTRRKPITCLACVLEGTHLVAQGLTEWHDFAGFEAVDVHMSDLARGRVRLDAFRGLVACGGFSYGDVLGAGCLLAELAALIAFAAAKG